jgi:hypothetical protein
MHIEDEDLIKFHRGKLVQDKLLFILEHTKQCTYCAERLMSIEIEEGLKAPAYLKNNLIKRTHMPDVKTEVQVKKASKNVQLFMYSLKTTAAVLGALILLFSAGNIKIVNYFENINLELITVSWGNQLDEKTNQITNIMNNLSNVIVNGGLDK